MTVMAVMINLFFAIFIISGRASENHEYKRKDSTYGTTTVWKKIWDSNLAGLINPNNDLANDRLDELDERLDDLEESYNLSANQLIGTNPATIEKRDSFFKLKSSIIDWVLFWRCYLTAHC